MVLGIKLSLSLLILFCGLYRATGWTGGAEGATPPWQRLWLCCGSESWQCEQGPPVIFWAMSITLCRPLLSTAVHPGVLRCEAVRQDALCSSLGEGHHSFSSRLFLICSLEVEMRCEISSAVGPSSLLLWRSSAMWKFERVDPSHTPSFEEELALFCFLLKSILWFLWSSVWGYSLNVTLPVLRWAPPRLYHQQIWWWRHELEGFNASTEVGQDPEIEEFWMFRMKPEL